MAANEQLIDQVIAPVTTEQVTTLTKLLGDLDIQMVADIKTANSLNAVLANSKSFSDYNKNSAAAAIQLEKVQQAQNKTAQTTITLDNVQKKAAADQQAWDDKAAANLARKEAQQAASDAKQIAAAETKAAKLAAIEAESARKSGRDFASPAQSNNPVTTDDSPAVRYEPIITGNEDMSATAQKSTEAIAAENAALLEQQEVLGSLTVAQRANIEALLALQAERAANTAELKALNIEDAASGERAVALTAEQVRLKIAIQQVTVELNRQTKEALAADGAMAKLDQSVLLLRTAYEQLSVAERESEQGQAMLAELNALDAENKKLALTVGNTSKQIGDYEKGIGKASAVTVVADKITAQFVRQLTRMAAEFLLVTLAFGAIQWLYDYIKNLDIFTGRLNQAVQNFKALGDVMKNADSIAGDNIANLKILYAATQDVTLSEQQRIEAAETLRRMYPDILKNASNAAILNGQEAASIDQITKSLIKEAEADAALQKIRTLSGQLLDIEFQKQKIRNAKSNEDMRAITQFRQDVRQGDPDAEKIGQDRLDQDAVSARSAMDQQNANAKVIQGQIDFLTKFAGVGDIASVLEKSPPKIKKASDATNTELLEYYRLQLEEAKKQSGLIVNDETQSYDTRLQALKVYQLASQQLVKNAEAIALADKNISAQKRKNIELQFSNELLDVDRDTAEQRLKIQKDNLDKILEVSKESIEDQLETLDNGSKLALRALTEVKDAKINALSLERAQGKIDEKKYNEDILAINDQFAIDRISQEITTQQAILAAKEGNTDATALRMKVDGSTLAEINKFVSGANKGIQGTKDTIANLTDDRDNAVSKQKVDGTKSASAQKKETQETVDKVSQAGNKAEMDAIDSIDKLRQKAFENEISRLEKLQEQVDINANNEKQQVQDSIASNATKAREVAVIDKQAAAQKQALQTEINKEKHKADVAEKEATIAKIIATGALAVVTALANEFPLSIILAALTGAAVAVELATAIATPLPTYATGGKWKPGLGLWGEAGTERANLPDGSVRYSTGAEVTSFPVGTTITPHMELMRQIRPEPVKFAGAEQVGWKDVLGQLKKMESKPARNYIRVNVDNGFETYKRNYLKR